MTQQTRDSFLLSDPQASRLWRLTVVLSLLFLLIACDGNSWNNPYPRSDAGQQIYYSSFSERPKTLDPVRAYSENEYAFIAQIYEPPLQYHFLKRPYQLTTLAAAEMPRVRYLDAEGELLPDGAAQEQIAFSEYEITIKQGMRYQPHPALAKNEQGEYRYHALSHGFISGINTLADFAKNGTREVTAEDYVYQIKRLALPSLHSPISGLMEEYIVDLSEFGKRADEAYKRVKRETGEENPYLDLRPFRLAGVEVVDRYRYRIRIKGEYPQFIYWQAMSFFAPMPWEAEAFYRQPGMVKKNITLTWYPIGSGAFMLSENNPNLRMVLSKNPNFHGEAYPSVGGPGDQGAGFLADAGQPLPLIDKAIYSLEKESIPKWNKFLQGFYDASGVSSDSFDQAIQMSGQGDLTLTDEMQGKGIEMASAVSSSIFYLGFNMTDPVLGGDSERARKLRQAISIAVDFEEYISIFLNGRGIAAQGPVPPGIFGTRSGVDGVNPAVYEIHDGKPQRRNIEQAKRLLDEAGYPYGVDTKNGEPLVLNYDTTASGPGGKAHMDWMRKQFEKIGIQLVIRSSDYNRFQDKIREGTAQIYMLGWNADYPDPENFMFLLYGPNGKVEHDGENASNYSSPVFDALFVKMKSMSNGPERQAVIAEMGDLLRHDAPWSWGFHPKGVSLFHAWYKNVKPNLMANNTLKYKRIDPVRRQQLRAEWNPPVVWPIGLGLLLLIVSIVPAVRVYRRRMGSAAR
ncbi:MAG: ABC transporter substrate-binding protein [Gammaproteobacteria bacterium]|nr:ABC transporter substrate-binding protein [Gammaproteobacteria bacterium]